MANWDDVQTSVNDVKGILNAMDEERDLQYNGVLAVGAICSAILALGVRVDYALGTLNRP